jgi:hypothetical protein
MITAYGDPDTKRKAIEGGAEPLLELTPTLQVCYFEPDDVLS